ncbi:type II toxin-antitoxin system RelE/ParE family toxin [Chitinophaga sp. XS-30]|uniref:type II toxin-antitoxin system RelE family toxin n=1 Tax=Chitinophaga sp. XS-30 TaxID=2604421 RepID=UPI0011DE3C53|nr:type II toxin-antitoxin system RelE/ParE family toxin [Chitinophaga sp. XS-30]QEH41120.1 type II toxin-antitoxin system RelE/ParE family toxin [Chitinophaga sp. XS-30]
MYQVIFEKSAQKKLYKLPAAIRDRIIAKVKALVTDPRPPGCKKLMGREGYRIRVGDYRVIYLIEDEKLIVLVVDVGNRKDIYE